MVICAKFIGDDWMLTFEDPRAMDMYKNVINDFPYQKFEVNNFNKYMVKMRDGVNLCTRVYCSKELSEPYDVLFTRNPYPANLEVCEGLYLPFVEQGYCVIIQDCRGTGESEGQWQPFENERLDGIDSLKWLNEQSWVRSIATFGRSYSSYTQWIVGDCLPDKVKTMFLEVYGINRFNQVYNNGLFREDIYTSWAFANSGVKSDISTGQQYQKALEIYPAIMRDQKILGCQLPFYQDYLTHINREDDYWEKSIWKILEDVPSKINIPVVVTDGWADHHLEGGLQGFENLRPEIKKQSKLIITPTDHVNATTGDLKYPDADKYGFMNAKAALIWFNHILKGSSENLESGLYQMRSGKWLEPIDIENTCEKKIYLEPEVLTDEINANENQFISYRYNPKNSNTWLGGNELLAWITPGFTDLPHGFVKTDKYEKREDVLIFCSKKYEEGLDIRGEITLNLSVATDKEDTAFCVRICEKTVDGKYINIKDAGTSILGNKSLAIESYIPGQKIDLKISFGKVVWNLHPGSALVLLISSSNFPMYSIHSNKKGLWSCQDIDENIAEQKVYVNGKSYINIKIAR